MPAAAAMAVSLSIDSRTSVPTFFRLYASEAEIATVCTIAPTTARLTVGTGRQRRPPHRPTPAMTSLQPVLARISATLSTVSYDARFGPFAPLRRPTCHVGSYDLHECLRDTRRKDRLVTRPESAGGSLRVRVAGTLTPNATKSNPKAALAPSPPSLLLHAPPVFNLGGAQQTPMVTGSSLSSFGS